MFKQLRNRFLILNLVIISTMMLVSFLTIYLVTWQNINRDIQMQLHKSSELFTRPKQEISENHGQEDRRPKDLTLSKPGERFITFLLQTDENWTVTSSFSSFQLEKSFYESAKETAHLQNKQTGTFQLDGEIWAYTSEPMENGHRLIFLEVTSQRSILRTLIYTFGAVACFMLILIFFISRYFANKSIKPVQQAFEKQRQFVADASHELRTPLAVIGTNIDVLRSNHEDTIANNIKWLDYIKSETDRMTKLTNDLLYLTQMDYSESRLVYARLSFSEAVTNTALAMEAVAFEHKLSLSYDIEPNLYVNGAEEQLRQVIMILLDNAIKYTDAGGTIDIKLSQHHNEAILTVTNSGEGIALEHIERIFDRFYRTDKSRSRAQGGYGLGLSIAKAVVKLHKGSIHVKSIPSKTTVFTVELPLI